MIALPGTRNIQRGIILGVGVFLGRNIKSNALSRLLGLTVHIVAICAVCRLRLLGDGRISLLSGCRSMADASLVCHGGVRGNAPAGILVPLVVVISHVNIFFLVLSASTEQAGSLSSVSHDVLLTLGACAK